MKRKVKISLIIVGSIALIFGLVHYIGVLGFLFAFELNIVLMMCVFLLTDTLQYEFKSNYYSEKAWEDNGKIYEKLGINFFRKILVWIGWEKLNKKANPVKSDTQALLHLEHRTKQSEVGHILVFFVVIGFAGYVAFTFGIKEALWLLALNVVFNLYPIFLQRYNRPRLKRALAARKKREEQLQSRS